MCAVSYIGDNWKPSFPNIPWQEREVPVNSTFVIEGVSQEDFNQLKKEVLELKKLLKAAKIYDDENGEPECE